MYRQRFNLRSHVLPQDACGKTFTEIGSHAKLARRFEMLADDPGLGIVIGDAGLGKTSAMRHLTAKLPRPDYQVVYVCDTATSPLDFYRQLARELGLTPSHRRSQLWHDIKASIVQRADEQHIKLVIVVDEAQHLSDTFLLDLSGFLNFAFDSRNLITFWLVGQTPLKNRLAMQMHSALDSRVAARVALEPLTERHDFSAFLKAGLSAAGAESNIVSDSAAE
ncbi:MAG: ATP-binding protein, partial [Deltaproteobacteria bacterium]|nr:ATP-binding protein [Deltaproteobacteria bacterium]